MLYYFLNESPSHFNRSFSLFCLHVYDVWIWWCNGSIKMKSLAELKEFLNFRHELHNFIQLNIMMLKSLCKRSKACFQNDLKGVKNERIEDEYSVSSLKWIAWLTCAGWSFFSFTRSTLMQAVGEEKPFD